MVWLDFHDNGIEHLPFFIHEDFVHNIKQTKAHLLISVLASYHLRL